MRKALFTSIQLTFAVLSFSQISQPPHTPATDRMASLAQRKALLDNSLVKQVPFQSIGPTVFSGRVADIEVDPDDPTHFFVAYASGGLWKTENNGQSFTPIFDNEAVMTIGDIAVDWSANTIWVGTGEVNSSRSSYAGMGVFKSTDGGKTWQHKGLGESHHIGKVLVDPKAPNTVWVAALGHLYSPNPERGVYKTTDGGETWQQVLFVNDNTGAVELVQDPNDPNLLYAATWHRERRAWNFVESGEGSGIFKSNDKGATWQRVSGAGSGFPTGEGVGRIGLATASSDGKTVLFAVLDNQARRPKEIKSDEGLTDDQLREMSPAAFLKLDESLITDYLKANNFPEKYTAEEVLELVKSGKIKPAALVEYTEDANSLLFDTPVVGAEVYRSEDGGKSWSKTHAGFLDDVYYSYGYYFGKIFVHPTQPEQLYILGVPVLRSEDGGKNWKSMDEDNVHADHHALWIDPQRAGHLILGNDGGINISYDNGENWSKCNTPAVGQFYYVAVDFAKTYNVYGGLQDNGVWTGPSSYQPGVYWHASGQYPYKSLLGGDGMQVAVDPRDNETVYTGFQFGNYYRINKTTRDSKRITPMHELGERPLRWNWQTPIHLSSHHPDILYMGSNLLHRSFNQGDDFKPISADLTKGGQKGDVAFGTLTAVHESPLRFGLLYTGSDDGLVHVSKDGGLNWKSITHGLPSDLWVSRVQASQHSEGRVFAVLNGYRWDDFTPYLYVSEDFGENWTRIGTDLPLEPVNVVKEDPKKPELLYLGTDHGVYVSLDLGVHFMRMDGGLPAVAVHDLVVHPRDGDLIVGTHGRSIYKAPIRPLQALTDSILQNEIYVYELEKVKFRNNWGNEAGVWSGEIREPEIGLTLFSKTAGKANINVLFADQKLQAWEADLVTGLNYLTYHGELAEASVVGFEKKLNEKRKKDEKPVKLKMAENGKFYLQKATYTVLVEKNGQKTERKLVVE